MLGKIKADKYVRVINVKLIYCFFSCIYQKLQSDLKRDADN